MCTSSGQIGGGPSQRDRCALRGQRAFCAPPSEQPSSPRATSRHCVHACARVVLERVVIVLVSSTLLSQRLCCKPPVPPVPASKQVWQTPSPYRSDNAPHVDVGTPARRQQAAACSRNVVHARTSSLLAACPLRSSTPAAGALLAAAPRKEAPASLRRTCSPHTTAHATRRATGLCCRSGHARRPAPQRLRQPDGLAAGAAVQQSLLCAPQKRPCAQKSHAAAPRPLPLVMSRGPARARRGTLVWKEVSRDRMSASRLPVSLRLALYSAWRRCQSVSSAASSSSTCARARAPSPGQLQV